MPTWLIVILVVAAIGGIIGYFSSNDGERAEGALSGAGSAGIGCGYIILQIFLFLFGILVLFKIGSWLFG